MERHYKQKKAGCGLPQTSLLAILLFLLSSPKGICCCHRVYNVSASN
jgi:hypothetical protein